MDSALNGKGAVLFRIGLAMFVVGAVFSVLGYFWYGFGGTNILFYSLAIGGVAGMARGRITAVAAVHALTDVDAPVPDAVLADALRAAGESAVPAVGLYGPEDPDHCWQCGAWIKLSQRMCFKCGTTQPEHKRWRHATGGAAHDLHSTAAPAYVPGAQAPWGKSAAPDEVEEPTFEVPMYTPGTTQPPVHLIDASDPAAEMVGALSGPLSFSGPTAKLRGPTAGTDAGRLRPAPDSRAGRHPTAWPQYPLPD